VLWNALAIPFLLAFLGSMLAADVGHADDAGVALCASCHGARGLPVDPSTPIIWGQKDTYIQKQLRDFQDGDRDSQIMSSMAGSLAAADVATVAKFLASHAWPSRTSDGARTQFEATLQPILQQCLACHSAKEGSEFSSADAVPRIAGQSYEYLSQTLEAFANGERANSEIMTAVVAALDAQQRDDLARYFSAL
jgi:cytochrome c553